MKKGKHSALEARIARGAVAHYEDAAYYDFTYKRRRHDVRFYVQMAEQYGGPVLELGVGSGRVATAIARAGIDVVGIEPVAAMLNAAKEKQKALPKGKQGHLTLRRGDARTVRLARTFPLVISPFNVFMHLYTRRCLERAFASVRAHLAPKGRFVFDVLMPDLRAMTRNPGRLLKGPKLRHPTTGRPLYYMEAFDYDAVREVQMVSMIFQDAERLDEMTIVPLSQRQFFPQELELLLHYNGFVIEHRYGDFSRGELDGTSESQIIVARAR